MPELTTGDPVLDQTIRAKLPEVVDLAFAVLKDRYPSLDEKHLGQTAAIIVSQLLTPMMELFVAGVAGRLDDVFIEEGEES